ncbi:hypothetical protein [Mucilaginibacter sp.]|uniref:hypothetical protein n=1 Tax=Mucilaginibacter sp. TaxID=1882438 RepID=UPI00263931B8|nr:hypothetical protein [Mucilaginibacter sp.]MDB4921233.1 hypothetical protein [Mucilaginibacter sp.]
MKFLNRSYWEKFLGLTHKAATKEDVMYMPIKKLGLGKEFNRQCKTMGFKTLHEVTLIEPMELVELDGFDYNWLSELVKFLNERQLLHLLQPLPGKSVR